MKEINGAWYTRKEWDLYTYRVKVRFNLIDGSDRSMDLYTSETDKHKIRVAINDTLNRDICATFEVECYTTREQDERTSEFLDEYFKLDETKPESLDTVYKRILDETRPERNNVMNGNNKNAQIALEEIYEGYQVIHSVSIAKTKGKRDNLKCADDVVRSIMRTIKRKQLFWCFSNDY